MSLFETREKEFLEEMNENKRVPYEYVAYARMGKRKVVRDIGGNGLRCCVESRTK